MMPLQIRENRRNIGGGRVLVGSAVFKTVSRALVPSWVGSIPMHLRQPSIFRPVSSQPAE
jgi:hypothetical protein